MIYFNGQILTNASVFTDNYNFAQNETVLLSGKTKVVTDTNRIFSPEFTCYPDSKTEVDTLIGYVGISCTLIVDSDSYIGMKIKPPISITQYSPGKYKYIIKFTQDTS